jgi:hypothetical protein
LFLLKKRSYLLGEDSLLIPGFDFEQSSIDAFSYVSLESDSSREKGRLAVASDVDMPPPL